MLRFASTDAARALLVTIHGEGCVRCIFRACPSMVGEPHRCENKNPARRRGLRGGKGGLRSAQSCHAISVVTIRIAHPHAAVAVDARHPAPAAVIAIESITADEEA